MTQRAVREHTSEVYVNSIQREGNRCSQVAALLRPEALKAAPRLLLRVLGFPCFLPKPLIADCPLPRLLLAR